MPIGAAALENALEIRSIIVLLAAVAVGCSDRPKAPALSNDPIYYNPAESFRFVAPQGWGQTAKSDLPPGAVDKERLLVRYEGRTGDAPATFEVSCLDALESADLTEILAAPSHSIKNWKPNGTPEAISAQNVAAIRHAYRSGESMKEVVVFRRGGRAYFFTSLYAVKDVKSREQLRRVVESVIWTN